MTSMPRSRSHAGPALLDHAFRPFFLAGAAWAALATIAWLPMSFGEIGAPGHFAPIDWHVHEMIHGYLAAVMAGFLLTAVANWTGRLPLRGTPLALLLASWMAGRVAMSASAAIGPLATAVADLSFLALLAAAVAREVVAGRNWRNLAPVAVLLLFLAANAEFHLAAAAGRPADVARRLSVAAAILLVVLFGTRIIPSFTRNWLSRARPGRLPAPHSALDRIAAAACVAALAAWTVAPGSRAAGALMLAAAAATAIQLSRWAGERTARERLLAILHVGYAFVPLGFLLGGAASLAPGEVPPSAGIHAWTAGAIGTMTIAMMTRVSRGHTGRVLTADTRTEAIYLLVLAAAIARIGAAFAPAHGFELLHVAAGAWALAFLLFAFAYGPMLMGPRADAPRARLAE